jgi:hypothetical protein
VTRLFVERKWYGEAGVMCSSADLPLVKESVECNGEFLHVYHTDVSCELTVPVDYVFEIHWPTRS